MKNTVNEHIELNQVKVKDGFWDKRTRLITDKVIPYQWDALNDNIPDVPPSHSVENFRIAAGITTGEFKGMPFQDSDAAKWIEAASYSLINEPNAELEQLIDELVDLIAYAQKDDGYLNTYFTVAKPDQKWQDISHGHELYCAGHMIEAAVAYYQATSKDKLLQVVCKFADLIDNLIGPEEGKMKIYPGHPEIELALVRLYEVTKETRYLKLAEFFVKERGHHSKFMSQEKSFALGRKDKWFQLDYHQAHLPMEEQTTAEGHSVRAMYLYCAMADLALETGDAKLLEQSKTLWDNAVNKRMYITGALGSQGHGERFTIDYDLPNDVAYAETCASIGLVFWAHRMAKLEVNREYADAMERALYNGVISGMSLDGEKYFYVNPLEVFPKQANYRHDHAHVETERVGWFGCACCPPNIARLTTSIGQYIYTQNHNAIFTHLYIGNESSFNVNGKEVNITQQRNYPYNGDISITVNPAEEVAFDFYVRIPGWCDSYTLKVDGEKIAADENMVNGYVKIVKTWDKACKIELNLEMPVKKMRSHPKVKENAGKIALQRGPVVYCLEEIDNGEDLMNITIPKQAEFNVIDQPDLLDGIVTLVGDGYRITAQPTSNQLYQSHEFTEEPVQLTAVPYSHWGNRKPGEMLVWVRES
ncbi:glycoside hydrolase family 127 protein [Gracilibacillus oryzae]|uniref:Glycoside hydrolase family 127 protein n=1 Tax=Gracilibacillus oryzae TaxID=1672701 RepID=A0A7C8L6R5_9BACI|nr:beta-L-arabinofuranosidase domain-containing protein [Gracilibacillus oryzae]KAB8133613.1 glycoside hydrolase family 127 protein [Gracilibacillus oryzae]